MEYNVLLTEHARDDLKNIHKYITFELLSLHNAAGISKGILQKTAVSEIAQPLG